MIIAISGKAGSGKDEVGKIIQYLTSPSAISKGTYTHCQQYGHVYDVDFVIHKFAAKLKSSIEHKFPNDFNAFLWETSGSEYRDEVIKCLGMTRRELLIDEAMALRGINKDYWVAALMGEYTLARKWLITDMRFPNELEAVVEKQGFCLRVERPGAKLIDSISETSLDHIVGQGKGLDDVIINDGTIEQLVQCVRHWMIERELL